MADNFNFQSHRGADRDQPSTYYPERSQTGAMPTLTTYRLLPQRIKYSGRSYVRNEPVIKTPIAFYDSSVEGQGVPINQPFGGHSPILTITGGSDLVFANNPYMGTMSLHIMWPGYEALPGATEPEVFTIDPATLTRAMLAQVVANRVQLFMRRAAKAKSTQEDYVIGHRGIQMDQVYLFGIKNTYFTAWQATLYIKS